jgi:hypothetical protein
MVTGHIVTRMGEISRSKIARDHGTQLKKAEIVYREQKDH